MAETLTTRCLCLLILLVGLLALFVPCVSAQAPRVEDVMSAFALLSPTTLYGVPLQIQGSVRFNQVSAMNQSIAVTVIVTGASSLNGAYGLQIRQFGDLTDPAAGSKVGATFVGGGSQQPGCPPTLPRQEGSLGNFTAVNGVINQTRVFLPDAAGLYLSGVQQSIVGLSVVLLSGPDSCTSVETTANILAQGVIGIVNVDNNFAEFEADVTGAVSVLTPTSLCPGCSGTVWFTQSPTTVTVTAQIFGLAVGSAHEINVHQYGDMSGPAESMMGNHYNPNGRSHQLPPVMPRHMGDLGNIQSYDPSGVAWYQYSTTNIPDLHEIIGRAVVIDLDPDHGSGAGCDQDGFAGPALLVGVIGVANPTTSPAAIPSNVQINNNWQNMACTSPWNDAHTSMKAAIIIGYILVALFLVIILAMLAYWWFKIRAHGDYEEVGEMTRLRQ